MSAVRRALGVALIALAAAGCGALAAPPADESRVAAVGRIADMDVNHGYVIAEFPTGRMFVTMDKREMGRYRVGDALRVDSFGRPLP